MYFVYILLCADDTLYTGITTDLSRRVNEHREGKGARYTRARGVKRLLYSARKRTRSSASREEARIKRLSRKEKLALIAGEANWTHPVKRNRMAK
jgi:putative endonuclease